MENSNNSVNNKASNNTRTAANDIDHYESQEESGWTMYLEDFLQQNNNKEHNEYSSISSAYESSLIADAGSSIKAAKKLADDEQINVRFGVKLDNNRAYCCNRLSFKKRKTKEANLVDDDLEDTASSPVHSPKVFKLNQMGVESKEKNDNHINMFEDKGISSGHGRHIQRSNEQLACFIERESDCTDLKKRGLCLVPLSMMVSYIG